MIRLMKTLKTALRLGEPIYENFVYRSNVSKGRVNFHSIQRVPCVINTMKYCTVASESPESASLSEADMEIITKGDPQLKHKLQVLLLEAEVLRQEGQAVPENCFIKNAHWEELLQLKSKSARRKFFQFLFKVEKKKENRLKKKEEKRLEWEQRRPELQKSTNEEDYVLNYTLGGNHIFLRFYDTTINQMYNNRLIQAMQFGQKLVIDCGYEQDMIKREISNCAKQLMLLFADNRSHDDPFDLHYCNAPRDGQLMKNLNKFLVTMYEPWFPLNLHEQSYLDVFPKEQLVYLTPHCKEAMTEYDHNAVYIIGGIVDKVNQAPLSLAKAKREGLRMQKLPLDKYLDWGSGSGKSLTINQVVSVLLDMKNTGDWKYALRHVPRRKLSDLDLTSEITKFNNRLSLKKRTYEWTAKSQTFDNLSYKPKDKNRKRINVDKIMKQ